MTKYCPTEGTLIIGLETDLERRKICIFHMIVLKEKKIKVSYNGYEI